MLPVIVGDQIPVRIGPDSNFRLNLYPITVEFDRLLKRQQQLKSGQLPHLGSLGSCSSGSSSSPRVSSPIPVVARGKCNFWPASSASLLSDHDAGELLQATIVHYYSTLPSGIDSNDPRHNEADALHNLHRTLCTPGTRTILMVANKNEFNQLCLRLSQLRDFGNKSKTTQIDHIKDDNEGEVEHVEEAYSDHIYSDFEVSKISEDQRKRQEFLSSSGINTSLSEDCLTQEDPYLSKSFKLRQQISLTTPRSRFDKISYLFNLKSSLKPMRRRLRSFNISAQNTRILQDFDKYLENALEKKKLLNEILVNSTETMSEDYTKMIGLEQVILASGTFYKSYRLEGVKVMELVLISVQTQYQRHGIGSHLLKVIKENGQIGPYDAIRVQLERNELRAFFAKNDFTDDLILNASFEQLSICSDGDEELESEMESSTRRTESEESENRKTYLQHSFSVGQFDRKSPNRRSRSRASRTDHHTTLTMCYLPPFSVGTLSLSPTSGGLPNQNVLYELDHRFVDDIIEQASGVWRRDLLSAYRTQWSCVARLRAEIERLRDQLHQKDQAFDKLRRENYQLRSALLQNKSNSSSTPSSSSLTCSQQLYLLRNFDFNSLDF